MIIQVLALVVLVGLAAWWVWGGTSANSLEDARVRRRRLWAVILAAGAAGLFAMRLVPFAIIAGVASVVVGTGVLERLFGRLEQGKPDGLLGPGGAETTRVSTRFLELELNHQTGDLSGQVLKGPLTGRTISSLTLAEAQALWRECRINDPQSAQILETYLERVHGPAWAAADTTGDDMAPEEEPPRPRAARRSAMPEEEALRILGLAPGASAEEIRDAHRRLMRQVHPDRGGSDYLAQQINAAKAALLDD